MIKKGLNFRTLESQKEYFSTYEESLKLITIAYEEKYISTTFGESYVICSGDNNNPPLVLLHAASCGSTIWYKNIPYWSKYFRVYAIDLIGESSKSILLKKLKTAEEYAKWLDETLLGLGLCQIYLCGLSIGGWNAANYAGFYPQKIRKLILLSPVQTFAKMHRSFFWKIMKMGFHPTRKNIENYIGWGSEKEEALPDSIIKQFTLSVMNMNANVSFPKWLKKEHLSNLKMPVLVLFGENEFAFSLQKAKERAIHILPNGEVEIIQDTSHLIALGKPNVINKSVVEFIEKE